MTTPLDNRIPPPVLMLATAIGMGLAGSHLQASPLPLAARITCAALAFLIAGRFGFPAIAAFNRAGTTINPVAIERASTLVTEGIYARTRNPMYVALTALLVALALALGQPLLLAGPALFALYIHVFQIMPEERAMAAKFGATYGAYRRAVRRWI